MRFRLASTAALTAVLTIVVSEQAAGQQAARILVGPGSVDVRLSETPPANWTAVNPTFPKTTTNKPDGAVPTGNPRQLTVFFEPNMIFDGSQGVWHVYDTSQSAVPGAPPFQIIAIRQLTAGNPVTLVVYINGVLAVTRTTPSPAPSSQIKPGNVVLLWGSHCVLIDGMWYCS
jgi:hypothetical protein